MKVIKQINNNAALALDGDGNELVILGKGVGFPKMPYELTDLSRIEKTFYDVNPQYVGMAGELPRPIILASADIAELAEIELDCELNPNLPFTLADHLNFAIERIRKGISLTTPIAYDVLHLYPKETEIGYQALDILEQRVGVRLPDSEVVNMALHLINAEMEGGDMHSMMQMFNIIADVDAIVEKRLHVRLDRDSFHYSRFAMHLRYLIQRLSAGEPTEESGGSMLRQLAREYPDIYLCAEAVADYFQDTWNWKCNEEERLYLMLHINRVQEKSQP